MPRLSIVIACLDETEVFETTLASVLQHRPDDCEVIVVHPFQYSDPYELAGEVRFVDAGTGFDGGTGGNGGKGLDVLRLLNAGLESAKGEVVHFLEPGTQVEEGWAETAIDKFQHHCVAAVSPLVVEAGDRRRVAYAGVRRGLAGRRRLAGVGRAVDRIARRTGVIGPSLHAAFYRRSTLQEIGGFDTYLGTTAADVDLALSLQQLGFDCVTASECQVIGPVPPGHSKASFAAGRGDERVYWRHTPSQQRISAWLAHPLAVTTELLTNLPRGGAIGNLCGRLFAFFDLTGYRRHSRRMDRVRAALGISQDTAEDLETPKVDQHEIRNQAA